MDKTRKSFWFLLGFVIATAVFLMLGPQRASGQTVAFYFPADSSGN